jgi:hypothetical protein
MEKAMRTSLYCLLLAAPILAQSSMWRDQPLSRENLRSLDSEVAPQAPALVVFDTADQAWRPAFEAFASDARLAEIPLLERWEGVGVAPILYRREGWKPGPHWALVDRDNQILAQGATVPSASALKTAVEASGARSPLQEMRSFLAQAPENAEARMAFVRRLADVAEKRTLVALGLRTPPPRSPDQTETGFSDGSGFVHSTLPDLDEQLAGVPAKDLDREQDEDIWGEYCQELGKVFEADYWAGLPQEGAYRAPLRIQPRLASPLLRFSPMGREASRRALPVIEALLRRFPNHGRAWQLWCDFAKAGDGDAKRLLASLDPMPGAALEWPPVILRRTLLNQARESGDWKSVAELSDDAFERVLEIARGERAYAKTQRPGEIPFMPWLDATFWQATVAPLLEAHLAMGHSGQAKDVMERWETFDGWKGAFAEAARMARKADQEMLAKAWEAKAPRAKD